MRKRGFRKFLLLFLIITILGVVTWRIKLQLGDLSLPTPQASEKQVLANMANIQDITGQFLIFPGPIDIFTGLLSLPTQNLWIETYEFTEKTIQSLFKTLLDKGTEIQLILEDNKYQQYASTYTPIANMFSGYSNFGIKSDKQMKTVYVHSKIDVMDSGFFIKTANMTHSSLFENREYMLYSTNSGVLQSLKTIFQKDRAGEPIKIGDIHPNLLVCNINCRIVIENMLKTAKESIIIETQYINDAALLDILSSQQKKLKEFKILVSDTDTNDTLIGYLPDVTKKLTKPYLHAKMILIDHKLLLLGSMNLSSTSLDQNREFWILLKDPAMIQAFTTQFSKDWTQGK